MSAKLNPYDVARCVYRLKAACRIGLMTEEELLCEILSMTKGYTAEDFQQATLLASQMRGSGITVH